MHKATYDDRVEVQAKNNEWVIVHVVTAHWYDKQNYSGHSLDIYEEDENGNCRCRNLYYTSYAGYVVAFPGEPYVYSSWSYWGEEIAEVEEWREFKHHEFLCCRNKLTSKEQDKITALHPDFKYVIKKWPEATIDKIMQVLPIWKKHPEIELLLAAGFEKVALNKSFYRLRDENKKKIIKWILNWPEYKTFTLQQIECVIKNNYDTRQYSKFITFRNKVSYRCKYETFCYLQKHAIADTSNYYLYKDYLTLVKQTEHSLKEEYWLYPSNLEVAHAKVLEEVKIINKIKKSKEREKLEHDLKTVTSRASKFNTQIDGFDIFVTNDMTVWEEQANILHQCIIHCNYAEKMIKGNLILVFIQKHGVPIATAEIKKNLGKLTIGQFYADEHSNTPIGSRPSIEVQNAFNKYFKTLDKTIFKRNKKKILSVVNG